MTVKVFIDTNIFLAFYEVAQDDLIKLSDAFSLADHEEIFFISTPLVRSEFQRRRAHVIANSLKTLKELRIPTVPTMANDLDEMSSFVEARKSIASAHKTLVEALEAKVRDKALVADELISKVFEKSHYLTITPKVLAEAKTRIECGNPPGKRGELGDAINWEALLTLADKKSELVVVTQDRDFADPLEKNKLNEFLAAEWRAGHSGSVSYFQTLGAFLKQYFPALEIDLFASVDAKINALAGARSFADTHSAISDLNSVEYFTSRQINYLVDILEKNSQVNWIFGDDDVNSFYSKILGEFGEKLGYFEHQYLTEMNNYDGTGPEPTMVPF